MGKTQHDDVLDAPLKEIADNCDKLILCSTQPTTYTEAVTTYALAAATMTKGDGNGDYVIGDGDASGRKLTVAEQADVDVDATGDGQHLALVDVGNTKLVYVTTCTLQNVTSGNTVTFPAFDIEIADVV